MPEAQNTNANAERLKAEGNVLYGQHKYKAAYKKYTEAIKEDRKNAILWSNRAACSLAIKDYLNGAADAQKAVQIDPKYAKAWSRLATAFQRLTIWEKSINAWIKAIACLPTEELSEQEKLLLKQFKDGLKDTEEAFKQSRTHQNIHAHQFLKDDAPWQRALAMEQEVTGVVSSAWVIMNAYRDFQYGLEALGKQTSRKVGNKIVDQGSYGAITDLTNAILRDSRVFHVKDSEFFEKYNLQIEGETKLTKAWKNVGYKQVIAEAPKRLARSDWDDLRMAFAVTIRGWIMADFFSNTINGTSSSEFYRNAIEVLEWGRKTWPNVSRKDRGPIFELTFIRGVKRLYLKAVMRAYRTDQANAPLSLEEIAEFAQGMIDDVQENAYDQRTFGHTIDTGFWQSFWPYVEGDAYAALGWYHVRLAMAEEEDPKTRKSEFLQSAEAYHKAAMCFSSDDEYRPYFLKMALEGFCWAGLPLKVTLRTCKTIRESLPGVKRIWEHSQFSPELNRHMEQVLTFEIDYRDRIERGELTEDDVAALEGIVPIKEGGTVTVSE